MKGPYYGSGNGMGYESYIIYPHYYDIKNLNQNCDKIKSESVIQLEIYL